MRAKTAVTEETKEASESGGADEEAEEQKDSERPPADSDNGSSAAASSSSHDADLCRCYLGHCMHAVQLHIALLSAAGYNNVT